MENQRLHDHGTYPRLVRDLKKIDTLLKPQVFHLLGILIEFLSLWIPRLVRVYKRVWTQAYGHSNSSIGFNPFVLQLSWQLPQPLSLSECL